MICIGWLGFVTGQILYFDDTLKDAISVLFITILFIQLIIYFSNVRFDSISEHNINNKFIYYGALLMILTLNIYSLYILYFLVKFEGTLGEFRMYFFRNIIFDNEYSLMYFVYSNTIFIPIILVLMVSKIKYLSATASFTYLFYCLVTNFRFGIIIFCVCYIIVNQYKINLKKLVFFIFFIVIIYLLFSLIRYREDNQNFSELLIKVFFGSFDYLTISAGVYDLYYGLAPDISFGPVTFLETILSKIFFFKSTEGLLADVSGGLLFYTTHGTGPYNAFTTYLGYFKLFSPTIDMGLGFLSLLLFFGFSLIFKNKLKIFLRFQIISILVSSFMPYFFSLAWFIGSIFSYWCDRKICPIDQNYKIRGGN
jgi:hypothetical protein